MTAIQRLIDRMRTFDGFFDGYPSMTETDIGLIQDARAEIIGIDDNMTMLCFLASEHCRNRDELTAAWDFVRQYLENLWDCNMSEGSNEAYAEQCQSELL